MCQKSDTHFSIVTIMKFKVEYKDKQKFGNEDLLKMKQFVESKNIKTVKNVSLAQEKIKKGQMGPGLGSALVGLVGAATEPLTMLFSSIVEWVRLHRSDVKLRLDNGEELVISGNLCKSKKAINDIVETFVNKTLEMRQKTPASAKKEHSLPPTPPPPPQAPQQEKDSK